MTIDIQNINKYLNCELSASENLAEFEATVERYPWFSLYRILLLKAYKEQNDSRFAGELKTTALYARNRKILRDFLEKEIRPADIFVLEADVPIEHTPEKDSIPVEKNQDGIDLLMGFGNEYFSLDNDIAIGEPNSSEDELITKFIKENPRIVPKVSDQPDNTLPDGEAEEPASEILARIYLQQGLYNKAEACYRKLILIYPEKSIYFADLIEKIGK